MTFLLHWLAARINAALDRWEAYLDPHPLCRECQQLIDPDGHGHLVTCRRWGT